MSRKYQPGQYVDPQGVIVDGPLPNAGIVAVGTAAPTNSVSGYEKGCLWINRSGGVGTTLYINNGTSSSSTWVNIF